MKVLFVDQFGKTTGRDTLALANLVSCDDIKMTVYLSDTTEIPNKEYYVSIQKGFHGAYEGNVINKVKCYLKALKELKQYIRLNHFDIVHLQWFSLPWIEWIYVKSLKKYAKVVITVHDVIPFDRKPLELQALDCIYSYADHLLVHTERAREELKKNYKASTPISVTTQGFCYKPDYVQIDKAEARKKLGISFDNVVFLYYGTIRHSKGLDTLLEAVASAQKKNKKIYLLAAGAFHKVDEAMYRSLAEIVVKTGSKVDFGFLPFEMEKYYFSASDVLVLPYKEGTQSGVAQLGLMYELPLIASDIYCMDEIAIEGRNALRFKAGNSEELMRCICKLAENETERMSFSYESKVIGESDFSLENKAFRVKKAYYETTSE